MTKYIHTVYRIVRIVHGAWLIKCPVSSFQCPAQLAPSNLQ
jgi:hypothetical protein